MVAQLDEAYRQAGPGRTLVRLASYALFEGRPLTTRGQWFNPVVLGLANTMARIGPRDNVTQPVFIVGTGRSGTTLLGKVLSLHRDVGYLNEPKALWHAAVGDEDVIGSYSETPGRYCLTGDDATPEIIERFQRLYGAYLRVVRRHRVVDKYPEVIFRVPFVQAVFPDARFIWLLRDGRDTVASIARWSSSYRDETRTGRDSWWGRDDRKWLSLVEQVCADQAILTTDASELRSLTSDVDRAAVEWAVSALQGTKLLKSSPDNIMLLRYEDLTANPEAAVRDTLEFCGLDGDDAVMSYVQSVVTANASVSPPSLSSQVCDLFDRAMRVTGYS